MKKRCFSFSGCLLMAAAVGLIASGALACNPGWSVQGVIDWKPFYYGQPELVHKVYDEGWNLTNLPAGKTLADFAAWDGYKFLPRDEDFNVAVPFGNVAGAAAVITPAPLPAGHIDWYRIWIWPDVNGNGKADSADCVLINGEMNVPDWQILRFECGEPGWYDPASGEADIVSLFGNNPALIQNGSHYLLLLEVHAHVPSVGSAPPDCASSLEFRGGVSLASSSRVNVSVTPRVEKGWDPSDPSRKYIDNEGYRLNTSGERVPGPKTTGVDDFEILWLRVNNPPRAPRF